ncbi:type II CRISPR RNA-guided endonuclease Cas9 [Mucilaginibacter ginsenosidivorax]|uniref:CRISPR-associated endonuclease Cas9 n=1 Tax=Mucilaginibacter ginsenosidivorax TaxID=862126 RepID=A0A5B8W8D7_9SPHI|nr:type II CRISPR RNA-guided endonuclease Cas9 [Mucilaginibacter ginsenosidivorax]QEC79245.1 type II CRISPR RNA-guided endonuclease Cas9 [Mucilaginibacter ginsenosidivorax]
MKKILGLDIGTNSVGWALVHEPELPDESYSIAGIGVRIIPLSSDENDEFTKGNAMSKNADRTLRRGARRNLQRYKLRRRQLGILLEALNMMPDKKLFLLSALDLYGLRAKGVTEQLALQEIGRIFFHLNQKRGYKSNRKANNDEEQTAVTAAEETEASNAKPKKKGYLDLINDREQALKDEGITIGQHFYTQLLIDDKIRIKENIYLRSTYLDEFDRIWNKQQAYYPEVLTEDNKQKIRNETIYYQRPLRSQKGLVSNCLFEKHHKATPKSSPLFQVAKIWQELNNIELTSFKAMKGQEQGFDKQGKRPLTIEEKQSLFNLLTVKGKLTTKDCLKELGYKSGYDEYKLNIRNEKELEGNRTYAAIRKVFDHFKINHEELLQFNLTSDQKVNKQTGEVYGQLQIGAGFEREPLFQLWHLLYSVEEIDTLIAKLQSRYGFSPEAAKALAKIDFAKQGYGNLSAKAFRNIVPYLQKGLNYAEACKTAGYNHSNSQTTAQNEARDLIDKLELYPKNSLRQPVVEKIINQVINLVNEIIDENNGYVTNQERYKGAFEIRVELARELRQNAEERNKAYSRNSKQDKRHKEIEAIIKQLLPFRRVSRNDIERYKLWEEFGKVSPYEPQKAISLGELFSGEYDIEHIIPKSRLFDDSFSNKTICPKRLNSGSFGSKNQMTAHDFMKSQGDHTYNAYLEFIKIHLYKKDGISKAKFNKLMMSLDKIPEDFINRQLQETRFITKEVRNLLTQICRNVHATSGPVTSEIRHLWGWDDVIMDLQIDRYKTVNQTELIEYVTNGQTHKKEKIIGWSKREDHRHHAIDALTVACTKQGFINRINKVNAQENRDEMFNEVKGTRFNDRLSLLQKYLILQRPFETAKVLTAIDNILVSFKSGKKVTSNSNNLIKQGSSTHKTIEVIPRGFLHKETVYGRIKRFKEISLSPRFNNLKEVARREIRAQITEYLRQFDNDIKQAFNNKNLSLFKERTGYDKVVIYYYEHVVRYKLDTNFKVADVESIVDEGVKAIVKAHLAKYGNNPKEAFKNENTIWLNQEKGIAARSVRCFTGYTDLQPLHKNEYGEPIDFVITRNNHHIAIYRDKDGKMQENTVSFWDAVKRKQAKLPVIIKEPGMVWDEVINSGFDDQELLQGLPQPDWVYLTSLQQNEMFVFGLADKELQSAISVKNYALISKHLYRVQKMSKRSSGAIDLWFRHHLETKLDDSLAAKELNKFLNIQSLGGVNGMKVKVDNIGRIVKV